MFLSRIIRNVREELKCIELPYNGEVNIFKMKDDIVFVNFEGSENKYFIEYSVNGSLGSKYNNKLIMENNGIKTGVIKGSENIIVYEDYVYGDDYRVANEEDFKSEVFVKYLAKWYKKFHSIKDLKGGNYFDCFCKENILKVKEKYNLVNNKFIEYVERNFDNINLKFRRTKNCFAVSDISMKNIVVSKKNPELLVIDFNEVNKGNCSMDITSVFKFLDEEMQKVFYEEYGIISEEEFVVTDVVMSLVKLFLLIETQNNVSEISDCLNAVTSEKMYEKVKLLVNWY